MYLKIGLDWITSEAFSSLRGLGLWDSGIWDSGIWDCGIRDSGILGLCALLSLLLSLPWLVAVPSPGSPAPINDVSPCAPGLGFGTFSLGLQCGAVGLAGAGPGDGAGRLCHPGAAWGWLCPRKSSGTGAEGGFITAGSARGEEEKPGRGC